MKVSKLINALSELPPDMEIYDNDGQTIVGVQVMDGLVSLGYFGPVFKREEDGEVKGLFFLSLTEEDSRIVTTTY